MNLKLVTLILITVLCATVAHADDLPDKPMPRINTSEKVAHIAPHRFLDRKNFALIGTASLFAAADTSFTCHALSLPYSHEYILPTQSCSGVAFYLLGNVALEIGESYLLHKTGHHRLERLPYFISIGLNTGGLYSSVQHYHPY